MSETRAPTLTRCLLHLPEPRTALAVDSASLTTPPLPPNRLTDLLAPSSLVLIPVTCLPTKVLACSVSLPPLLPVRPPQARKRVPRQLPVCRGETLLSRMTVTEAHPPVRLTLSVRVQCRVTSAGEETTTRTPLFGVR